MISSKRLRDFAIYLAISICVVVIVFSAARANIDGERFVRWGGLMVNTSVLFGYFIADS